MSCFDWEMEGLQIKVKSWKWIKLASKSLCCWVLWILKDLWVLIDRVLYKLGPSLMSSVREFSWGSSVRRSSIEPSVIRSSIRFWFPKSSLGSSDLFSGIPLTKHGDSKQNENKKFILVWIVVLPSKNGTEDIAKK